MTEVELLVVCEGEDGSLDVRVLERVLERHGVRARVMAAGNATALATLCRALKHPFDLAFEMKDSDFAAVAATIAVPDKPRKLRWRRHEVENFLVDPQVVLRAFDDLRRGPPFLPWVSQAPVDLAGARALMAELATDLLDDHVGGTMWFTRYVRSTRNNPATFRRPADPEVREAGWARTLRSEAARVVADCNALAADPLFASASIDEDWGRRLSELKASDFVRSGRYLIEMEGKALVGALYRRVVSWGGARVKRRDFESQLLDALLSLLGTADEPADFLALVAHLRAHAASLGGR